jgi:hypothetical protein
LVLCTRVGTYHLGVGSSDGCLLGFISLHKKGGIFEFVPSRVVGFQGTNSFNHD